jgi:tetratricopeptide (TPR) repeat protein
VVYGFQKKYAEAIQAYKAMLKIYPNDAEVYYGMGIIYFLNLNDSEAGLDNICKAYTIYVSEKSPYRSDAEKVINMIHAQMKKEKKEAAFDKILKDNQISPF